MHSPQLRRSRAASALDPVQWNACDAGAARERIGAGAAHRRHPLRDAAGIYKPCPKVYRLAVDRLQLEPAEIAFVSANGWDAAGAAAFGFTTFWINRNGEPVERHAREPDFIVGSLANLVPIAQMYPA
jgi:2-haloacid dehalogenase